MKKVNKKSEFQCKNCNKLYSSKSSLCNHIKKYHKVNTTILPQNTTILPQNTTILPQNTTILPQNTTILPQNTTIFTPTNTINKCKYCNKILSRYDALKRHYNICNENKDENKTIDLEKEINELKSQFALILKEKGKMHHKTLQKFNNKLNTINNSSINNGNINNSGVNNGNINNGKIINNTYVKFGNLDYTKIFNDKQIMDILKKQYRCLEESIKQVHFNENHSEYNNVFITNMKDDTAYIFDGKKFILVWKKEMLNELIDTHTNEINISLEKNRNKLNQSYVTRLEKFLDMLNDDDTKYTEGCNDKTYPNYKAYKIDEIKLLIYNESDKKKLESLCNIELIEKKD